MLLANHSPATTDPPSYDWLTEDNYAKLKGILLPALQKMLAVVHAGVSADEAAMDYVERLMLKLFAMLTSKPGPANVQDVEDRVRKTFPNPIDQWTLNETKTVLDRRKKKSDLNLPVDKLHLFLAKEVLQNKHDEQVTLFIVAVLEFISLDILKLTGNYIKQIRKNHITEQDIKTAICADKALMDMFYQADEIHLEDQNGNLRNKPAQTYDEVVKDFTMCEKKYLRILYMITKVFREQIQRSEVASSGELDMIFSNIIDIAELTITLIGSIEDTKEMSEDGQVTAIGPCFEELAEAEEFDVYDKYARDVLSPAGGQYLESLLGRPEVAGKLQTSGHGFREAVRYYLPKLLLVPVSHCLQYFKYIELLTKLAPHREEKDILKQVTAMLTPLNNKLNTALSSSPVLTGTSLLTKRKSIDIFHRCGPGRQSRQQSLLRLNQLQQSITGWEGKDIVAHSSEIVYEGKLKVGSDRRKMKDRYVILCDSMLIVCTQQSGIRRPSSSTMSSGSSGSGSGSSAGGQLHYRSKYLIRLINIVDRDDEDGLKYSFEFWQRDQQRTIFKCETAEEKKDWLAVLVMLNTKSMLERSLDVILSDEEKKHPLRLPDPSVYKFAETDSPENIVFEEREKSSGVQPIKGATLVKLVERLTYHVHATPIFMKTFLTTYRSFCTPMDLLTLLIARFNIPDPEMLTAGAAADAEADPSGDQTDKNRKMRCALDLKRFRKEYAQPVQFRVLNVLKHWVDQHFYDFGEDSELLHTLNTFLDGITGKSMRKWVECISKVVQRRLDNENSEKEILFNFDRSPPSLEYHIKSPQEDWPEILTYHPVEIARQLTLIEFQYYRAVKPSELVDLAWTREDKDKRSPNLLRMGSHTTNFTRYLEKLILDTDNMEERVAVMQRVLEIMVVLQEYNNFNGVLAITSALNSSAVHRLVSSKDKLPGHLLKALEDATSLVADHFKLYLEKLRSINPPCVPFFGQYQTNILFLEEGNPDFLQQSDKLINFSKRRKVAEIISEIQQYQNQPYCLLEYGKLRLFLESLDPFPNSTEKEITDYLWERSVEIEPRASDTVKRRNAERRWPGLNLKSPGIKKGKNPPHPLPKLSSGSSHQFGSGTLMRQTKDDGPTSPLSSPNNYGGSPGVTTATTTNPLLFRQSPVSTPVTPGGSTIQMSPRSIEDGVGSDPIKIPVILPTGPITSSSSGTTATGVPLVPISGSLVPPPPPPPPLSSGQSASSAAKPPPLPPKPKPPRYHSSLSHPHQHSLHHQAHQFHFADSIPPLPPKDSSPPPPIPPRSIQPAIVGTNTLPHMRSGTSGSSGYMMGGSSKPVMHLESRNPIMDPVFPIRDTQTASVCGSSVGKMSLPPPPRSRNGVLGLHQQFGNMQMLDAAGGGSAALGRGTGDSSISPAAVSPSRHMSQAGGSNSGSASLQQPMSHHHHHPPPLSAGPLTSVGPSTDSHQRVGSAPPSSAGWTTGSSSSHHHPHHHMPPFYQTSSSAAGGGNSSATTANNGPVSAGPEMGSHFTFGHHLVNSYSGSVPTAATASSSSSSVASISPAPGTAHSQPPSGSSIFSSTAPNMPPPAPPSCGPAPVLPPRAGQKNSATSQLYSSATTSPR